MDASPELGIAAPRVGGALPPGTSRLVRSLSLAVVLQWAGAGALLPLLPLYVKDHGGTDAVVGAVMAGYFAAAFAFQYGAGRLSDRFGRLVVLLGGLFAYAAGSLLFLVPGPAVLGVAFRALQGAGAGAAMVAALAALSHAVPMSHRGRATGRLYGAQLGGLGVGPVLGSLAGVGAMRWLFVAAAAASILAAGPVLVARRAVESDAGSDGRLLPGAASAPPAQRAWSGGWRLPRSIGERAVWGALVAAAVIGLTSGVYEACWTLLMTRHGAAAWAVGVSWTLFAVPFALMSRPAGWLADHFDRRRLGIAALAWSAAFCATYPFLPGYVVLMVLGIWESLGFALALPACQSLLGEGTAAERHGHAQGMFAASQTGTTALAAAFAGGLFGIAPWLPFVTATGCCFALLAVVVVMWRKVPAQTRLAAGAASATTEP